MSIRDFNIQHYESIEQPNGSYINKWGEAHWYDTHGNLHREDGPAVIYANGDVYWFIGGIRMFSLNEWFKYNTCITDEDKMMLRLQYG
jgi:hypothetical protein